MGRLVSRVALMWGEMYGARHLAITIMSLNWLVSFLEIVLKFCNETRMDGEKFFQVLCMLGYLCKGKSFGMSRGHYESWWLTHPKGIHCHITHCKRWDKMVRAVPSSRNPTLRGRGRVWKNNGKQEEGEPINLGGKPRGWKPTVNIINEAKKAYHEGINEEIWQLIEKWGDDLNRQEGSMEIEADDLRVLVLDPEHTCDRVTQLKHPLFLY